MSGRHPQTYEKAANYVSFRAKRKARMRVNIEELSGSQSQRGWCSLVACEYAESWIKSNDKDQDGQHNIMALQGHGAGVKCNPSNW